jgi:hypothetical protein
LNVDLNDWFSVVSRGCTLVVSGERRVIAIDELEKMLKWSWLIWGMLQYGFPGRADGNHEERRLEYRRLGEGCYPVRNKAANH